MIKIKTVVIILKILAFVRAFKPASWGILGYKLTTSAMILLIQFNVLIVFIFCRKS